jgi:hypothetical protein
LASIRNRATVRRAARPETAALDAAGAVLASLGLLAFALVLSETRESNLAAAFIHVSLA